MGVMPGWDESVNSYSRQHEAFRFWAREQFAEYRGCVAFVVTEHGGQQRVGSAFHVGEGVFVTARHVVEGRVIKEVGFDDQGTSQALVEDPKYWGRQKHGQVNVIDGPRFHRDQRVDVRCLRIEPYPRAAIPLGGHLDDWLAQYELVLHRTLLLGYPPIPLADRPILVASVGEINALVELYVGCKHPHFIISSTARGGFSGGPVLVAYNEDNPHGGTAALGVVTQSLARDGIEPELGYMTVLTVEPIYDCLEQHQMLPKAQALSK